MGVQGRRAPAVRVTRHVQEVSYGKSKPIARPSGVPVGNANRGRPVHLSRFYRVPDFMRVIVLRWRVV